MTQNFANVFVFLCGRCNSPVAAVAACTPTKRAQQDFSGKHVPARCQFCGEEALHLADDAATFQSVEWNFEIRSQFHTKSI